jgi:NADH:ubiquinone oxidoreductase subunit 4 (subunit M)
MYLLFILLFPLALGSFLLLAKPKNAFVISLTGSIIEAITVAYVLIQSSQSPNALAISYPWIPEAGLSFSLYSKYGKS